MRRLANLFWVIGALRFGQIYGIYVPLREYAGSTFFDRWDYYGYIDNTTWGKCSSHQVVVPFDHIQVVI